MGNIKTAISIEKHLFEEAETLAKGLNITRSRFFALAAEEFIQRHKNQKLLDAINRAHDDLSEVDDEKYLNRMRSRHRNLVKEQW